MAPGSTWGLALAIALLGLSGCDDGGGGGGAGGAAGGGDSGVRPADAGPSGGSAASIFINELMPLNQTTLSDEFDEFDDWLELYNDGDAEVVLEGWSLSDDPADPLRALLGAELRVPAKGVLLLWADKDEEQGPNHLGFKISGASEVLILSDPEGNEVDRFEWVDAVSDQVFARFPDGSGELVQCAHPTPRASNGAACGG